ncbi:hypothetical protein T459_20366 [Capsicum annuum]|uniref:F-box associated domain-containing protein n=1 Tax=Capsicum annuum TaxID=4072 RepID=A0A2G2Z4G7_CAPAN|nr:hypothetical protein T459_20366 [Capsicum annuum]
MESQGFHNASVVDFLLRKKVMIYLIFVFFHQILLFIYHNRHVLVVAEEVCPYTSGGDGTADEFGSRMVLVRFDVSRRFFEKLPMLGTGEKTKQNFIVIENSLGMLTWEEGDNFYIDVWAMDDENGWSKKCKVGPLFRFDRIVGCLRNGDIVTE